MQVMVTGGAGFIGSNLVDRLLAEGHSVDVVDNLSTRHRSPTWPKPEPSASHALTFHQLDVRSDELVEVMARRRPEVVFHLAAQADVRVSVERPVFDADVNVLGTLRVLEGARAAGTARVAFAASGGTLYGECDPVGAPGEGVASPPAALALRRVEDGGHRLSRGVPGAARPRVLCPGTRQRVRAAPGPPRRGRRRGDLLGQAAAGRARDHLRGRRADTRDFVYVDDVVDAFVRAGDARWWPRAQHRDRHRGVGQRAGPRHGRARRGHEPAGSRPAPHGRDPAQRPRPRARRHPSGLAGVDRPLEDGVDGVLEYARGRSAH